MATNRQVRSLARKECEALAEKYGVEGGVFPNIEKRLDERIMAAKSQVEAETIAKKTIVSMEMMCLAAWARGEANGLTTPESIERKARAAESLAKMLEGKEDSKGARSQLKRAVMLRAKIVAPTVNADVVTIPVDGMKMAFVETITKRKCGKCGQLGHNARTCGGLR